MADSSKRNDSNIFRIADLTWGHCTCVDDPIGLLVCIRCQWIELKGKERYIKTIDYVKTISE